ncbi:MAG: TonB-dependent receptor plug domain-containing protein, partial [Candidatus Aminicenantia bacterium]
MRKILVLLLSVLLSVLTVTSSQDSHPVNILVFDLANNPVEGVKIIIKNLKESGDIIGFTDRNGRYSKSLNPGWYEIITEFPYMKAEKKFVNVPAETKREIIFRLSRATLSEGITVTATRKSDYAELSPISSSSLSREEILKIQPRLLTEALLNIPGVQISDAGPFRPRPIIRGLDTTRILVLVDGYRFNTFRMSTGVLGAELGLIDQQNVERIEVVRGPGSMLYGSDAIGGIINIITKKPEYDEKLTFSGSFFSGYETINNGKNLDVSFNLSSKIFSLRASAGWDKFDEYKSSKAIVPNSQAESYNGDFKLGIKISPNHFLSIGYIFKRADNVGFVQREKAPGFDAEFPYNKREGINLSYEGETSFKVLRRINLNIYQQNWEREFLMTLTPPAMPFPLQSKTGYFMKSRGFDLQISSYPGGTHFLTYGINFIEDRSQDERVQKIFFGTPLERVDNTTSVPDGRVLNFGVFVQDEFSYKRSEMKATLRFDNFYLKPSATQFYKGPSLKDSQSSSVSGTIGAPIQRIENLKIFGRIARAFRTPGRSDRYYVGAPVPSAC